MSLSFLHPIIMGRVTRKKKGFTLVELLMAMSMLGALTLITSTHLIPQQDHAHVMSIRNTIMLLEGKGGEYLTLSPSRFDDWSMVTCDSVERAEEESALYNADGIVQNVEPTFYYQVSDDFSADYAPNDLSGVFLMNNKGLVYYADVDSQFTFDTYFPPEPDPVIPDEPSEEEDETAGSDDNSNDEFEEDGADRVITPESPILEGEEWVYADFEYSRGEVTGLSVDGLARYESGDRTLILPDVNPYTHEPVLTIGENAFRDYVFQGDLVSPTIEEIDRSAFRNSQFSGIFIMPNLQHIGADAFRFSQFSGEFKTPYILTIGRNAFRNSRFTGEFYAPNVQSIGNNAFRYSDFSNID